CVAAAACVAARGRPPWRPPEPSAWRPSRRGARSRSPSPRRSRSTSPTGRRGWSPTPPSPSATTSTGATAPSTGRWLRGGAHGCRGAAYRPPGFAPTPPRAEPPLRSRPGLVTLSVRRRHGVGAPTLTNPIDSRHDPPHPLRAVPRLPPRARPPLRRHPPHAPGRGRARGDVDAAPRPHRDPRRVRRADGPPRPQARGDPGRRPEQPPHRPRGAEDRDPRGEGGRRADGALLRHVLPRDHAAHGRPLGRRRGDVRGRRAHADDPEGGGDEAAADRGAARPPARDELRRPGLPGPRPSSRDARRPRPRSGGGPPPDPMEPPALLPLTRVLVPTDLSPRAEAAVDFAVRLAAPDGAEVVLLHVFAFPYDWYHWPSETLTGLRKHVEREAEGRLAALAQRKTTPAVRVRPHLVVRTDVASAVHATADDVGADLRSEEHTSE